MRAMLLVAVLLAGACTTTTSGGQTDPVPDAAPDAPDAAAGEEVCVLSELPQGATSGKRLRLVYLVPSDKEADPEVLAALEGAIRHVQLWLSERMPDGTTFRISEPPVEVSAVPNPAAYYASNDAGCAADQQFWCNTINDAFTVTGGSFADPGNVWLYYIDADADCGQVDAGANTHVAVFAANEIRGLRNQAPIDQCTGDEIEAPGRCRYVGGLAIIMFYAIGIAAPAACTDAAEAGTECPEQAITWLGYTTYPDAELIPENVEQAEANPFVRAIGLPECSMDCSVVP